MTVFLLMYAKRKGRYSGQNGIIIIECASKACCSATMLYVTWCECKGRRMWSQIYSWMLSTARTSKQGNMGYIPTHTELLALYIVFTRHFVSWINVRSVKFFVAVKFSWATLTHKNSSPRKFNPWNRGHKFLRLQLTFHFFILVHH